MHQIFAVWFINNTLKWLIKKKNMSAHAEGIAFILTIKVLGFFEEYSI